MSPPPPPSPPHFRVDFLGFTNDPFPQSVLLRLSLANGLFWTSVAFCLVAQILIVRSVLGARHLPAPSADVPRSRGAIELFWAVVPGVALAVLLVFTFRAMREHESATPPVAELPR